MATKLVIRLGRPREAPALEALQWRASLANAGDKEALLAHPDSIQLPIEQLTAGQVFVAERQSIIIGFAVALPRPDGQFELDGLFVEPATWKSGVGRALVEHCAAHAAAQGAIHLHVIGNPHAEGFYGACGFKTTGVHQTAFGPGMLMQMDLRLTRPQ